MAYKIIVARYNEDISWLRDEMSNCIIYNKGETLDIPNEIMLENVGRESDTYLEYIITNYHDLPPVMVFTQAGISDHNYNLNALIQLKNEAYQFSKSRNYFTHDDVGNNIHFDHNWNLQCSGYYLPNNYKTPITFSEWFKTNINVTYPNPIYIYGNGIFAVKRENVLQHPIEYYKKLLLELKHHNNPTEGHFFERSWYYIFK